MATYLALPDDHPSDSASSKPTPNENRASLLEGSEPTKQAQHHRPSKSPKTPQTSTLLIFRGLVYELISLAVAAASFLGLLVLLRAYDSKPEPKWSFVPWTERITLNTMVSIVSTVFRGCTLFPVATCISQFGWIWMMNPGGRSLQDLSSYNSASGGPVGSLNLLWRLRFWHHASIGAVITLVAFVSGPFFQQSVTYQPRAIIDPAFSPSANTVAAYSWVNGLTGWNYPYLAYQNLPFNMTAAMMGGLFTPDPKPISQPPSKCPTGNCTWESFGTLSVNSKCIDISSHFEKHVGTSGYYLQARDDPVLQSMFNQTSGSDEYHAFYITSDLPAIMNISVLQPFLNFTAAMAIVSWIRVLPGDLSKLYALLDETSTVEAHRCAIYFSAKEILPFVTNGVYKEYVLQEVTRPDNVQFLDNMVGPRKYFVHTQDNWDPLIFRLPGLHPDRENMFTVPSSAFTPIYSPLVDDLKGQVAIASRIFSNSTIIYMLYKANSVVQSIQNMADAITTEMRRNGSSVNPQQTIQGHVWIQQQFVVVRWVWLALPATMLVLTSCSSLPQSWKRAGRMLVCGFQARWRFSSTRVWTRAAKRFYPTRAPKLSLKS